MVVTRFSLKKATNNSGSQAQFRIDRPLTAEEQILINKLSEQVKGYSRCVGFDVEELAEMDAPFVDPETGEVVEPLLKDAPGAGGALCPSRPSGQIGGNTSYSCVTTLSKIKEYLAGAALVAFDFETSPLDEYRLEERADLDAHKSNITGMSFSVSEGSGIYVPLRHRIGKNAARPEAVMGYLQKALFENTAIMGSECNHNTLILQKPIRFLRIISKRDKLMPSNL